MGRRPLNTTKSGKYMNPADQTRKLERKKELKKNKKQRQLIRQALLKSQNPKQIISELEMLDDMEYNIEKPPFFREAVLQDKRKKLLAMLSKEKAEPTQFAELIKMRKEYDARRQEKYNFFEAIRKARNVNVDSIPLPTFPNTSGDNWGSFGQMGLYQDGFRGFSSSAMFMAGMPYVDPSSLSLMNCEMDLSGPTLGQHQHPLNFPTGGNSESFAMLPFQHPMKDGVLATSTVLEGQQSQQLASNAPFDTMCANKVIPGPPIEPIPPLSPIPYQRSRRDKENVSETENSPDRNKRLLHRHTKRRSRRSRSRNRDRKRNRHSASSRRSESRSRSRSKDSSAGSLRSRRRSSSSGSVRRKSDSRSPTSRHRRRTERESYHRRNGSHEKRKRSRSRSHNKTTKSSNNRERSSTRSKSLGSTDNEYEEIIAEDKSSEPNTTATLEKQESYQYPPNNQAPSFNKMLQQMAPPMFQNMAQNMSQFFMNQMRVPNMNPMLDHHQPFPQYDNHGRNAMAPPPPPNLYTDTAAVNNFDNQNQQRQNMSSGMKPKSINEPLTKPHSSVLVKPAANPESMSGQLQTSNTILSAPPMLKNVTISAPPQINKSTGTFGVEQLHQRPKDDVIQGQDYFKLNKDSTPMPSINTKPKQVTSTSSTGLTKKPSTTDILKSNHTVIEAKPQLRSLTEESLRFMPTILRVKRNTPLQVNKIKKNNDDKMFDLQYKNQQTNQTHAHAMISTQTKDDAYLTFMKEMEGLL